MIAKNGQYCTHIQTKIGLKEGPKQVFRRHLIYKYSIVSIMGPYKDIIFSLIRKKKNENKIKQKPRLTIVTTH